MSADKIAKDFVQAVQNDDEAGYKKYWADNIVSLEPQEGPMAKVEGREALQQKHDWWNANAEVHSSSAEGPFMFGDQFAVRYEMDVTMDGERNQMTEVGLYTVEGDKIVEERFMYGA